MGCGMTKTKPEKKIKKLERLEIFLLTVQEVDYILGDPAQRRGAYLVYEDADNGRTYLAFTSVARKPEHHSVVCRGDLYHFMGFTFPYLEAIILYYQRHCINGTRLTEQAFVHPYITAYRRRSRSLRSSEDVEGEPRIDNEKIDSSYLLEFGIYRPLKAL